MKDNELLWYGARRLAEVNAGLRPEERALVVCDTENLDIAWALVHEIKAIGAEYSLCVMEPRQTHGENPTEAIAQAMLGADVIFAPTKFSLSHSQARIRANEHGARFISMPDYTPDMLLKGGALDADFLKISESVAEMAEMLTNSHSIRVTTKAGTDITLYTKGRRGNEVSGVCREGGTWGSPPNIEANISPLEELSEGIIVVDGSIPMPEIGLITEELRLRIENGRIVEFMGQSQAECFRRLLKGHENPNNLILAEFGIGFNDKAALKGSMLEDEGAYGTCHFGFGHNADQGGANEATVHIDAVLREPEIYINGKRLQLS